MNSIYIDRGTTARDFEKVNSYHSTTGFLQNTNNPRLDELIVKVPTMPMSDEKKRLALEAVVLAKKEYTALAVVAPHNLLAVGPKIGDVSPIRNSFIMSLMFETITHAK